MKAELNMTFLAQKYENTCWEAVAKMVLYYMGYLADAEFVIEKENDPPGNPIEVLLRFWGHKLYQDGNPIPEMEEICSEINVGRPLIGFIAADSEDGVGHWIIIAGYDECEGQIKILDPDKGVFWMNYPVLQEVNGQMLYCYPYSDDEPVRYFHSVSYMPKSISNKKGIISYD